MQSGNPPTALRRSSRVPTAVPILVTTLAGRHFSEVCDTLVVNAHGCAFLSPVKFDAGVPLRFHSKDGRETLATVVSCQPFGADHRNWRLGAQLQQPENFWGLSECPQDWSVPSGPIVANLPQVTSPARVPRSPEATLDLIAQRLEAPMRKMIAQSLSPFQAELAAVKQALARREANPSRFEVSLSQIPPELEQQLETRLKKDVGPRVLEDSRQQYAQLLETAKSTIDQRVIEGHGEFRRRAAEELKGVERRAQDLSAHISANAQEHVRQGLAEFQQRLLDGGNSLKRLSEELLTYLQQNLNEEHSARRTELEQMRATVVAESSRLHKEVESLESRIAKLDKSARSLESGLDTRLGLMSGNIVKETRSQLESLANAALEDWASQTVKLMEDQLAEASATMTKARSETIESVSDLLNEQAAKISHGFERSMDEMAKLSVERWRLKLATNLDGVAKSLGEEFSLEAEAGDK